MTIDELKQLVTLDPMDQTVNRKRKGQNLVTDLMQSYRQAIHATQQTKTTLQEARVKLERTQLSLQNLQYEQQHILQEISQAQSYESIYQDIPLVPLEEYMEQASEEEKQAQGHELMINRLKYELKQRKQLFADIDLLKDKKRKLVQQQKDKRNAVEQLEHELDVILLAARPVETKLELQVSKERQTLEHSSLLPSPLFTLYQHIVGYQMIHGKRFNVENKLQVSIEGDRTEAAQYQLSMATQKVNTTLYQKHPLRLKLQLLTSEPVQLILNYLVGLQVVVVFTQSNHSGLPDDWLIQELFPGDVGLESPNPQNAYLEKGNFEFDLEQAGGRPYRWAQTLAGLHYPVPAGLKWSASPTHVQVGDSHLPFFSQVMTLVQERLDRLPSFKSFLSNFSPPLELPLPKMLQELDCKVVSLQGNEKLVYDCTLATTRSTLVLKIRLPPAYPTTHCLMSLEQCSLEDNFIKVS